MTAVAQVRENETATPWAGAENLRGRLRPNAELAKMIWFQAGGVADWLFKPEDHDDDARRRGGLHSSARPLLGFRRLHVT